MNILMFYKDKPSLDPIIYKYLKKQANVFLLSKNGGDLTINSDDTIDKKVLEMFIKKNNISHFFYAENSSYVPIILNDFPKEVVKVMLLIDTHINIKRRLPYFSLFDLILLVNKHQVKKLSKYNPNTMWLTYGGDTDYFRKIPNTKKKYNVFFNGNIIPWIHYHRFFLLTYLKLNKIPFHYSSEPYPKHNQLFNESKIVLNRSPKGGWNLRIFESLSAGSFLIMDRPKNEMENIFLDKKHVVYYDTLHDLKEKILYYLEHEQEREAIATEGYEFVRKNYSWDAQVKKMLTILKTHKYKSFKRKPYYLSLSNLQCYSFRNKNLALQSLESSIRKKEINKGHYIYFKSLYLTYLYTTEWFIRLLNFVRINLLVKPFEKKSQAKI